MEGSSFLTPVKRTTHLAEQIMMRRPAPLAVHVQEDHKPGLLQAARRWRDEWRKKRHVLFKP